MDVFGIVDCGVLIVVVVDFDAGVVELGLAVEGGEVVVEGVLGRAAGALSLVDIDVAEPLAWRPSAPTNPAAAAASANGPRLTTIALGRSFEPSRLGPRRMTTSRSPAPFAGTFHP